MEPIAVCIVQPHALSLASGAQPEALPGEMAQHARTGRVDAHIRRGSGTLARHRRIIGHEFPDEAGAVRDGASPFTTRDRIVAGPVLFCWHRHPAATAAAGARSAAATRSFGTRKARAALDFVETHPDRLLKAQLAVDE